LVVTTVAVYIEYFVDVFLYGSIDLTHP